MNRSTLLLIVLFWLAGLAAAGQFAKITVPFIEVVAAYPHAGNLSAWLLSSVSLVGAILGLTSGSLVARFGAERTLLVGLLLGGALSLAQSIGLSFGWMLATRIVEGVSHLLIVVAAPTLISRVAVGWLQGPALALWSTFFGVTFALVGWLGLPFVERYGVHAMFLAHAVSMFALTAVFFVIFRRGDGDRPQSADAAAGAAPPILAQHLRAYRSAAIVAAGAGWPFYTCTFVALLAILPSLLPQELRQPITTLMPLMAVVVSLTIAPFLLRALGGAGVAILGFALGCLAVITGAFGTPLPVLALLIFVTFGLIQSGTFAAVPELNATDQDRALAYGVVAQTGNFGNLVGTPLLLSVKDAFGVGMMLALVAALYAVATTIHVALQRRRRLGT
ncbi:MAG: MFS transporter [Pseudomonadota bacterium]